MFAVEKVFFLNKFNTLLTNKEAGYVYVRTVVVIALWASIGRGLIYT